MGWNYLSIPKLQWLHRWSLRRDKWFHPTLYIEGKPSHIPMVIHAYITSVAELTHWGWVTHICVSKLTIIGSDNGLSPARRQTIIWTDDGILLIGPLGTSFSEILIEIHTFSFQKMHLKMSSGKWRPFCLGLNMLTMVTYSWLLSTFTLAMSWPNGKCLFEAKKPAAPLTGHRKT